MNKNPRAILILAGGAGTRLWPLSTDENPKQFLKLFEGRSLIQLTWLRLSRLTDPQSVFVSTNERYAGLVAKQLPDLPAENILLEPSRRNTAPAIATCCMTISKRRPGATIGIFPSDHAILDEEAFGQVIERAFEHAESSGSLVTIGLQPTEPSTGYGYLELGEVVAEGVRRVTRFVEKPDAATARAFVESGRFAWNGGMFVWKDESFIRNLTEHAPEIASLSDRIARSESPQEQESLYAQMPSISIDYALMEKAGDVASATGEFGWSDVGSWKAVACLAGDSQTAGVITEDAENVFVRTSSGRPVAIVGLSGIAVVESEDGLLILNLERAELLSGVVKKIQS